MRKAKCLAYIATGKPVFTEIEIPEPCEDQVGIDIIASSMCNTSEIRSFRGGYETGYGSNYPMKNGEPGHEAVGKIISVGSEVNEFAVGDIVALTGHGGEPCHCSYVNRKTEDIARIDQKSINIKEAAVLEMYGCAYHCAMTPLSKEDYAGKRVLVIGMGSMGLCTVQILRNFKLNQLVAVDLSEQRLKMAVKSGADSAVFPINLDISKKFDVVIECSGSIPGQEMACALAPETLIFSSYNTNTITVKQNLWFDSHTTIYNPGIVTSENFKRVVQMYNENLLNPSIQIGKRIKPNEAEYLEAIDDIIKGRHVKVIIEWEQE